MRKRRILRTGSADNVIAGRKSLDVGQQSAFEFCVAVGDFGQHLFAQAVTDDFCIFCKAGMVEHTDNHDDQQDIHNA